MLNSISVSFLATLICCFSLLIYSHSFSAPSIETDRLSLLALKSQLHDPLGVTRSWNHSINLCQWTGVTCGRRHQRVTKLYLKNQSIEGEIPTNLSHCSNLIKFVARRNNLVGDIPVNIGISWLKLEALSFVENYLTGQLPASIGNLSALQVIDLRENRLDGRIPSTLGQLRNLVHLSLGENHFSGIVPPSIYNISSLEMISLWDNNFSGSLPLDIGVSLPNLRYFVVENNSFTGSIPYSFSNASHLEVLALSLNLFSGKVSINFSNFKNLSILNLKLNNLGNGAANDLDFVTTLTNCSKLKGLSLTDNRFGGVLPYFIANLSTSITYLAIGNNQITGAIPQGIGNLVNLNALGMEKNQLTGRIPHVIGELQNLQLLYININFLQGTIPTSLGNLSLLTALALESNNLQGNIPSSLENCKNLNELSLFDNMFTGALPPQILMITSLSIYLGLSDNLLNGSLPLEVGNLQNLISLDISRNQFSGKIPATLSACISLDYLNISRNSFNGSIPNSLSSLKSIQNLDLSSNNLSGRIPKYLENLSLLEYLNLSHNNFEGEVPTKGVFSNKTRISLSGNAKLCGGLDELHLSSCPSKTSRKSTINVLKIVIPTTASCLISLACVIFVYAQRRRSAHDEPFDRLLVEQPFPMVSYAELSKSTGEFSLSNMIGQGSFGSVYKGILGENGMLVAIKVINLEQKGASKSFLSECEALRNIRHRNLIKIITICSSIDFKGVDFKALVYEYMQNGSLEKWLHQSNDLLEVCNLSLIQRLNIAIDVASAIEYLHHHCQPPIIHGDLKPSNVLLDQDLVAHVSDFGLAKFIHDHTLNTALETQSSSIGIKGTVGYVAPEYGMGGEASLAGDVYSFGILLLELFTRRRPTDSIFNGVLTLHEFGNMALRGKVMEIVDPSLLSEVRMNNSRSCGDECLDVLVRIGVLCSMESQTERMEMKDVVSKLCTAKKSLLNMRI